MAMYSSGLLSTSLMALCAASVTVLMPAASKGAEVRMLTKGMVKNAVGRGEGRRSGGESRPGLSNQVGVKQQSKAKAPAWLTVQRLMPCAQDSGWQKGVTWRCCVGALAAWHAGLLVGVLLRERR